MMAKFPVHLHIFFLVLMLSCYSVKGQSDNGLPNIIIIFTDDMGYGDLSCYGQNNYQTPHLDRLADQGMKFTNFYVSQPVCSASRASLLTGCYANRVGIHGALFPDAKVGLNPSEITLAELCQQKGYATAMVGKWHLGDQTQFLPTRQGFDQYYGIPYSNDMWPMHPNNEQFDFPRLPVMKDEQVIYYLDEDQDMLTTNYTREALKFIHSHQNEPFFLYLAHSMPHVPLYVSDKFRGKSGAGIYGDVMMEIDWSVGEVIKTLKELNLNNTLVIFTSDNGPWLSYGTHSGVTGPLREGKGTVWEGGIRVPSIMYWPDQIPSGMVQKQPATTMDIFPTIADILGTDLPEKRIDGKSILPVILNKPWKITGPEAYFFYYKNNELQALLSGDGRWKLYFPHEYRSLEGRKGRSDGLPIPYNNRVKAGLELYDLENDISETTDVISQYPEVARELQELAQQMRLELGDRLNGKTGSGNRDVGMAN